MKRKSGKKHYNFDKPTSLGTTITIDDISYTLKSVLLNKKNSTTIIAIFDATNNSDYIKNINVFSSILLADGIIVSPITLFADKQPCSILGGKINPKKTKRGYIACRVHNHWKEFKIHMDKNHEPWTIMPVDVLREQFYEKNID